MSDDEPQMNRRGFLSEMKRRAKVMAFGATAGGALGVLSIEEGDTPEQQKKKVAGGALVGTAASVAVDGAVRRNPEQEHGEQRQEYERGRRWNYWDNRFKDRLEKDRQERERGDRER